MRRCSQSDPAVRQIRRMEKGKDLRIRLIFLKLRRTICPGHYTDLEVPREDSCWSRLFGKKVFAEKTPEQLHMYSRLETRRGHDGAVWARCAI